MNAKNQALFERISHFSFGDGVEDLTLLDRVARDNGWTYPYAERAVEEYRRFAGSRGMEV